MFSFKYTLCTTLLVLCVHPGWMSKILMMPGPHHSHVNFFSKGGEALQNSGHEVYVFTTEAHEKVVDKVGLNKIIFKTKPGNDLMVRLLPIIEKVNKGDVSFVEIFTKALRAMEDFCIDLNENTPLINTFMDKKFDLIIMDGTLFYSCVYIVPYRLGVKYISLTAMHSPWIFGVPALPSIEPIQLQAYSNRMSFFQRVMNLIGFSFLSSNPSSLLYSTELMEKFAPDKPYKTISQLMAQSEINLVVHNILCAGYPRVSALNYVYVGGLSATATKPLPPDLKNFADGASNGLVVLSFGSIKGLHSLWPSIKPKIMNALGRLPQRAIVQYVSDDVSDIPNNVKVVKWLPQNDLLGHPNTKLFITHGGNNGQLEAIFHGVPVLTIPFAGDQLYNGLQAVEKGYGLMIDRLTMTEELFYLSVHEIINNGTYAANIKKCSNITKSIPSAQENIVFWVQHVLDFGGDHLRSPGAELPFYKLFMLDVLAFLLVVFLTFMFISIFACIKIYKKCCSLKKQKEE